MVSNPKRLCEGDLSLGEDLYGFLLFRELTSPSSPELTLDRVEHDRVQLVRLHAT